MKTETSKQLYFRILASEILEKLDGRTYFELIEFCDYLKEAGKSATIQLRGLEAGIEEERYNEKIVKNGKQD